MVKPTKPETIEQSVPEAENESTDRVLRNRKPVKYDVDAESSDLSPPEVVGDKVEAMEKPIKDKKRKSDAVIDLPDGGEKETEKETSTKPAKGKKKAKVDKVEEPAKEPEIDIVGEKTDQIAEKSADLPVDVEKTEIA